MTKQEILDRIKKERPMIIADYRAADAFLDAVLKEFGEDEPLNEQQYDMILANYSLQMGVLVKTKGEDWKSFFANRQQARQQQPIMNEIGTVFTG